MHEITIANNLAGIVLESVSSGDLKKIKLIKIKVGLLSNVMPDSLQFCFNSIKDESGFDNAALEINNTPVKITCRNCHIKSEKFDYLFHCPECGSINIEVTGGDELEVTEIILNTKQEN